jgi:hypothetical protein
MLPLRALSISLAGTISISSLLSKTCRGCCEHQYKIMPDVQQAAKTHGTTMAAANAGRYRSVLSSARVVVLVATAALLALVVSGMLEMLVISVVVVPIVGCGVIAGSVIVFVARRYGTELVTPSIVVIGISLDPMISRDSSCFALAAVDSLSGQCRVGRDANLTPLVRMLLGRSIQVVSAKVYV